MNAELIHPANDPQIERAKSEREQALTSAYWCYFLAAMIMCVTAWFVIQGVNATEPDSPARSAKIAAGILLLIIEGCAFDLAGRWSEFSRQLKMVGWAMFALQVACMTLAQYSTATTAGKAAALSTATADEILKQNQAVRDGAKLVQADSERLQSSRHPWKQEAGAKRSEAALAAVASSTGNVEKLEKLQAKAISTPWVETLGPVWLFVFSLVFSLIFEGASVVLMHVAGSLRKKAADGQPVDSQILALLRKMSAQPSPAPAEKKEKKQADQEDRKPDDERTESDFEMGFVDRETKKQGVVEAKASHDMTLPGELWVPPQRRDYALRPTRQHEQDAQAGAPAAPAPIPSPAPAPRPAEPEPAPVPVPAPTVSDRVQEPVSDRVQASASDRVQKDAPADTPADVATPAPRAGQARVSKPRTARTEPAVRYDTSTAEDAVRYRKVVAAVQAGQINPSYGAIEKSACCNQRVAAKFRMAMLKDGVIEADPDKPGQFRRKQPSANPAQMQLEV